MTSPIVKRTATHEFVVQRCIYPHTGDAYTVDYRPLSPKTGEPWQAPRRVTDGATIEPDGWKNRPIAYPSIAAAEAARDRQIEKLRKRR